MPKKLLGLKSFVVNHRILVGIFLGGLILRFLYFPNDISFGYDQARDAYVAREILTGDLKIVGPPASVPDIHHGALSYYVFAPLYFIFNSSPVAMSAFFRFYNALGIFLVYAILFKLFRKSKIAFLGAFFYAISFEQTQFALFLGHPAFGIITALIALYGLTVFVSDKKFWGLYLTMLTLGLTIQFHFSSVNLVAAVMGTLLIYRKNLPTFSLKTLSIALTIFIITLSTYIAAELKYDFRQAKTVLGMLADGGKEGMALNNLYTIPARFVEINILNFSNISFFIFITIILAGIFISRKKVIKQFNLLLVWLVVGIIPYINYSGAQPSYYYSLSASVAFLGIFALITSKVVKFNRFLGIVTILVILFSNLSLIKKYNSKGTVPEINAQEGMLLTDALSVIDFTYKETEGQLFSVNALTIPYGINTTWSYLYEWYGKKTFGYVPIWGGEHALGYKTNLPIETAQSLLPPNRYTIFEPARGLTPELRNMFEKREDEFWEIIEEKNIGLFTVQKRKWKE